MNSIIQISKEDVERLKYSAYCASKRRDRICLHKGHNDPIQEMLIVCCRDSYIRPHRNVRSSKSFTVIEGELLLVMFNNNGEVKERLRMGRDTFLCRLNTNLWHTIVPISDYVVYLEINGGPFIEGADEYAQWAPEGDNMDEVESFMKEIRGTRK